LDAPRYFASIHIVCFHYYDGSYFKLGGLWTQFFFVLAGFLLAYAEMIRPVSKATNMGRLKYLRKRLITIYPLYALSICLLLTRPAYHQSCECEWEVLPLHIFLLQGIVQVDCCKPYGAWNGPAWFLSALVVYWLVTLDLCRCFRTLSLKQCYCWLAGCWVFSLALWPVNELIGDSSESGSSWLEHGPLGYFHVYIAGVAMARVFILRCMVDMETGAAPTADFGRLTLDTKSAPLAFRYGCIMGFTLWFALVACNQFVVSVHRAPTYYILHNGGLLPLMILILGGGALGADPLAQHVFRWRPFMILARLSFSQYILQGWVQEILQHHTLGMYFALPVLLPVAYIAQRVLERPLSDWQRQRARDGVLGWDEELVARVEDTLQHALDSKAQKALSGKEPLTDVATTGRR